MNLPGFQNLVGLFLYRQVEGIETASLQRPKAEGYLIYIWLIKIHTDHENIQNQNGAQKRG